MTLNAGNCNTQLGVWVDSGESNQSIAELDPAFDVPNTWPMFVAMDAVSEKVRPISSYTTVANVAAVFHGLITNASNSSTPLKKVMVYHKGGAEVFLNAATSVKKGDKLKPWVDPATGAISQNTFEYTAVVDDPLAVLTVCSDCVCPDYPKDPCDEGAAANDVSPTGAPAAPALAMKVKVRWCTDACGCA